MRFKVFGKTFELKQVLETVKKHSETGKCREALSKYCIGNGLDIGYGGDPIVPNAICLDMPEAYAKYLDNPQHLHGDARNLHWFKDACLDFIYSSHVLEDFKETGPVINEWLRVLKVAGVLVLYLPDEQTYREHCHQQGKPPNAHHIHLDFSLGFVKRILEKRNDVDVIYEKFPSGIYSFELVVRKK